mmetsp:Transcript_25462/g.42357  ORF Transcript_25462/g.42357 Transcript_25462/m.42357 type:complete len:86 (+) Transcript_25462:143-400(+)
MTRIKVKILLLSMHTPTQYSTVQYSTTWIVSGRRRNSSVLSELGGTDQDRKCGRHQGGKSQSVSQPKAMAILLARADLQSDAWRN